MTPGAHIMTLLCLTLPGTEQKLDLPNQVLQNDPLCRDCLVRVLLQSKAQHVHELCARNKTFCPTHLVNRITSMSWMFLNFGTPMQPLDRRHFCVIAHENTPKIQGLFRKKYPACRKGKIILSLPRLVSRDLLRLKKLFKRAWIAGIIDLIAVTSDVDCRVYSTVPFKKTANNCNDTTPTLIDSWAKDSTCTLNHDRAIYFPENKISSLNLCSVDVLVYKEGFKHWYPLIKFLEVAMNATFNLNVTTERISLRDPKKYLPTIYISSLAATESIMKYTLSSFIKVNEMVYAVPRRPISSVQWFRLLNELSRYVWYGLIVALVASTATLFYFVQGRKDLVCVVLLIVQPLLGSTWSVDFLPWRGRAFYTVWQFFCIILTATYLCEFLSEMTVPSTEDAIKSCADLVKSDIPVYSIVKPSVTYLYEQFSPHYNEIKSRVVFLKDDNLYNAVKRDRDDIAYLLRRSDFDTLFVGMPYRLLPEVVLTAMYMPFRMNKPNPYERLFEIAFMRAVGAGALVKLSSDDRHADLSVILRHTVWKEEGPKPLSLGSFFALFVVWSLGCGLACCVFIIECCLKKFVS